MMGKQWKTCALEMCLCVRVSMCQEQNQSKWRQNLDVSSENGEEPIGSSGEMWRLSHPLDLEVGNLPSCFALNHCVEALKFGARFYKLVSRSKWLYRYDQNIP